MSKTIYNYDIPTELWLKAFDYTTLRNIAKEFGVRLSMDESFNPYDHFGNINFNEDYKAAYVIAYNLARGIPSRGNTVKAFEVKLSVTKLFGFTA